MEDCPSRSRPCSGTGHSSQKSGPSRIESMWSCCCWLASLKWTSVTTGSLSPTVSEPMRCSNTRRMRPLEFCKPSTSSSIQTLVQADASPLSGPPSKAFNACTVPNAWSVSTRDSAVRSSSSTLWYLLDAYTSQKLCASWRRKAGRSSRSAARCAGRREDTRATIELAVASMPGERSCIVASCCPSHRLRRSAIAMSCDRSLASQYTSLVGKRTLRRRLSVGRRVSGR
mmetsp:Transcript_43018/g.101526  ORF Transcript_43018/g.101526 Transcript_43018/m.101526 type:complete len:228 (-) Transcript_43018:500-1183(-)